MVGVHKESFHGMQPQEVLSGELSIQVLDYISCLIKLQYPHVNGLQPPSEIYAASLKHQDSSLKLTKDPQAVQIHWICEHYLVSAQINTHLHVFDSLYNINHLVELKSQLRVIYTDSDNRNVNYTVPQSQGITNMCGFFAIANTLILLQNNYQIPLYTNFDLQKMRQHLHDCMISQHVLPFPTTSRYVCAYKNISGIYSTINKSTPRTQHEFPCESNLPNVSEHTKIQSSNVLKRRYKDKLRKQKKRKDNVFREKERAAEKNDETKIPPKQRKPYG